jgi:hypothetical protein
MFRSGWPLLRSKLARMPASPWSPMFQPRKNRLSGS